MKDRITEFRKLDIEIPRSPLSTKILIGEKILSNIANEIDLSPYTRLAVITEKQLRLPLGRELVKELTKQGKPIHLFTINASESNKTEKEADRVLGEIMTIDPPIDRKILFFALGGGVIGDMTGYITGRCLRGLDYCQVPTTLLAMADSSLGGKAAVDYKGFTNVIGLFHLPIATIMDISVLQSLSDRQFKSGLSELIKHSFLNTELFRFISGVNAHSFRKNGSQLIEGLKLSTEYKMGIIRQDFEEKIGVRTVLHFGHTIGRALETATGLTKLTHGEAVSLGMTAALLISNKMGYLSNQELNSLLGTMEKFDLPTTVSNIDRKLLWKAITADKKSIGGVPRFVLLEGVGKPKINCIVDKNIVNEALNKIIL